MAEFYSQASSSDEVQGYRGDDEISDCYEQPVVSYELGDKYGLGDLTTPEWPRRAEFIQEIGEYYVPAAQDIIGACMDGRPGSTAEAVPNGAGGGLLYLVTDRLVRGNSDAINEANARVLVRISRIPATVHVHRDDHAHGEQAGCAAADKVGAIFTIIAQRGEQLRVLATELGLGSDISDETHQQIIRHATDETKLVVASGDDLVTMVDARLAENTEPTGTHTDMLRGSHHEAVVVMNRRAGTTLDRQALAQEFDRASEHHQAFNIDTWAFAPSAEALYPGDPTAQQQAATAMLYYNLAAIMALCGPRMTVTVLT